MWGGGGGGGYYMLEQWKYIKIIHSGFTDHTRLHTGEHVIFWNQILLYMKSNPRSYVCTHVPLGSTVLNSVDYYSTTLDMILLIEYNNSKKVHVLPKVI